MTDTVTTYDPNRSHRVYLHTDPVSGRLARIPESVPASERDDYLATYPDLSSPYSGLV
jgi:hypothetical protein